MLEACFASVSDGEDYDLLAIEVIERHVSTLAELYYPLTELRQHLLDKAVDLGVFAQVLKTAADCFYCTRRGVMALGCEEGAKTGYVMKRGWRPD